MAKSFVVISLISKRTRSKPLRSPVREPRYKISTREECTFIFIYVYAFSEFLDQIHVF